MNALGIDIGSRYIKAALVRGGQLISWRKTETSFNPLERCAELLRELAAKRVVATGYGRHLLEDHEDIRSITEIKAFARGAKTTFPACRTIIDIGGQDTKVICLDEGGNVRKFEMNDRCAAGTGKFLEIMAVTLGYSIEELGSLAEINGPGIQLNSMCTVFAESEAVSLIAKGVAREQIAMAVQRSVAARVTAMARRLPVRDEVVFAGGCAVNMTLAAMIGKGLGKELKHAPLAEFTGALGAALYAEQDL
jgi:predicted CoA-substrate-specific enzyme activase